MEKKVSEIQQILFLLIKTGVVNLNAAPPNTIKFVESVMDEWKEEWRKEMNENGRHNNNSNPA